MLGAAWAALGGAPELADRLTAGPAARPLGGPFAVDELAVATIGAALIAALELRAARGGPLGTATLDPRHAGVAFHSERHARRGGEPTGVGFADLSRFWPTGDGCIRTHANYPHHRRALLSVIGEPAAIARWSAVELEDGIVAAGGAAAAVRDAATWRAHPQGAAMAALPLLDLTAAGERTARPLPELPEDGLPAAGVRVLDLTRVIAGPVGTRMLAALGADVLRIDPPQLPELESQWLDAAVGKRSALLDLRAYHDRAIFERLLGEADVVVHGYRPGALAPFGLEPAALAERHPHLVSVTLSAWGHCGPWAHRRGFDSLVQAASGIAAALAAADGTPGALPAQALDHGTGYLIAAAALRGLTVRATTGHAAHARLALARTADWLLCAPWAEGPAEPVDPEPYVAALGDVQLVAPPGALDGRPLAWPAPPPRYGADRPAFAA
ncbi:MAG TPA: CoA transferase [Capillimicrobium sp.]|nr:CoA transferase [Capillimicrobium sp.]